MANAGSGVVARGTAEVNYAMLIDPDPRSEQLQTS